MSEGNREPLLSPQADNSNAAHSGWACFKITGDGKRVPVATASQWPRQFFPWCYWPRQTG